MCTTSIKNATKYKYLCLTLHICTLVSLGTPMGGYAALWVSTYSSMIWYTGYYEYYRRVECFRRRRQQKLRYSHVICTRGYVVTTHAQLNVALAYRYHHMRPEHKVRRAEYARTQDDEQDGEPRSFLTMVKPASTSADRTSFSQRPRFITQCMQASIYHHGSVSTLHALHGGTVRYEFSCYCCSTTTE